MCVVITQWKMVNDAKTKQKMNSNCCQIKMDFIIGNELEHLIGIDVNGLGHFVRKLSHSLSFNFEFGEHEHPLQIYRTFAVHVICARALLCVAASSKFDMICVGQTKTIYDDAGVEEEEVQ